MSASAAARVRLRTLADVQAGVVTREQAEAHGVSARVIARLLDGEGHWRRLDRGVVLTAGSEPSFLARAWPARSSAVPVPASAARPRHGCTV